MYNIKSFEAALTEMNCNYDQFGPRSSRKVEPVHKWIANQIKIQCPIVDVRCASPEFGGKEYSVNGAIFPKKCDITVMSNGKVQAAVSFRAPWSNYSQNHINLLENCMGGVQ